MKNLRLIFMLLTFATLLVQPAFAADQQSDKEEPVVATMGEDGVQRVDIVGGEYYYKPNHIVVKVNKPVELRVKKAGRFIPHNIIVNAPEAGIDFKVELKSDFQTISFTPTKAGKYAMYCDHQLLWFASHREKGMEGIIEVVE